MTPLQYLKAVCTLQFVHTQMTGRVSVYDTQDPSGQTPPPSLSESPDTSAPLNSTM